MSAIGNAAQQLAQKAKEAYAKAKIALVLIGVLLVIVLLGSIIIAAIHGVKFIKKDVSSDYGATGTCPYTYSSLGLKSNTSPPIVKNVVDWFVGAVYSSKDGKSSGVLAGYRNKILENFSFQVVRISLSVFVVALLGISFAFGFTKLSAGEILKRFLILGVFLWATDARTYRFYDEVLEPLVLQGTTSLSATINGALLKTIDSPELAAYADLNGFRKDDVQAGGENEFVVLDALIASLFSDTIFNKIGALVFSDSSKFFFFGVVIYIVGIIIFFYIMLFAMSIIFYKLTIVIGLSVFPIFMLFTALKAVGGSVDQFSTYFKKYAEEMIIKPSISIILLTFTVSLLAMLIFELVAGMFSFEVCLITYFSPPRFLSFVGNFDYFTVIKPSEESHMVGKFLNVTKDEVLAHRGSDVDLIGKIITPNILLVFLFALLFKKGMDATKKIVHSFALGGGNGALAKVDNAISSLDDQLKSKVSSGIEKMNGKIGDKISGTDVERTTNPTANALQNQPNAATPTNDLAKDISNDKPTAYSGETSEGENENTTTENKEAAESGEVQRSEAADQQVTNETSKEAENTSNEKTSSTEDSTNNTAKEDSSSPAQQPAPQKRMATAEVSPGVASSKAVESQAPTSEAFSSTQKATLSPRRATAVQAPSLASSSIEANGEGVYIEPKAEIAQDVVRDVQSVTSNIIETEIEETVIENEIIEDTIETEVSSPDERLDTAKENSGKEPRWKVNVVDDSTGKVYQLDDNTKKLAEVKNYISKESSEKEPRWKVNVVDDSTGKVYQLDDNTKKLAEVKNYIAEVKQSVETPENVAKDIIDNKDNIPLSAIDNKASISKVEIPENITAVFEQPATNISDIPLENKVTDIPLENQVNEAFNDEAKASEISDTSAMVDPFALDQNFEDINTKNTLEEKAEAITEKLEKTKEKLAFLAKIEEEVNLRKEDASDREPQQAGTVPIKKIDRQALASQKSIERAREASTAGPAKWQLGFGRGNRDAKNINNQPKTQLTKEQKDRIAERQKEAEQKRLNNKKKTDK